LAVVGYPLDPQVYLISELPVRAEAQTFVLAGGSAIALAFGAAWLAAQRAAARSPVEALRRLD
jgi:ABC-type lipoprotein release transport system permease subunit